MTWESDGETVPTQRPLRSIARARRMRLVVTAGAQAGVEMTSDERVVVIGRGPEAQLRLDDPSASRFHCELSLSERGVLLRDLRSRNGTFFAGARVREAELPLPCSFSIGASVIQVSDAGAGDVIAAAPSRFGALLGQSAAMRAVFAALERLAKTELSLLIEGPTGTGKELAARAVHEHSGSASGPFVVVDCAAIPASLAESVLFGHERGSFTGAHAAQAGAFESAHKGTVFLDEIGELPAELQPKLLRVLERREVVRVGSHAPRPVTVRVLSATWRDLRAMVNDGRFREDLYYRLAHARVVLPALSERSEDVPLLVQRMLDERPAGAIGARAIAQDALDALANRAYLGNVRELRATVERAAALAQGAIITTRDLDGEQLIARGAQRPRAPQESAPIDAFKDAKRSVIDQFEREYLARLVERCGDNLSLAARSAGLERHSLRELLRRHGLRAE